MSLRHVVVCFAMFASTPRVNAQPPPVAGDESSAAGSAAPPPPPDNTTPPQKNTAPPTDNAAPPTQNTAPPPGTSGQTTKVTCSSKEGERTRCPANTTQGVVLQRVTGSGSCILGSSWGYEADAIWVTAGCGGEFVVGGAAPKAEEEAAEGKNSASFDGFEPGEGFTVARTKRGELSISAYALIRYINQMPAGADVRRPPRRVRAVRCARGHLRAPHHGLPQGLDRRPEARYQITLWTVNTTDQKALFGGRSAISSTARSASTAASTHCPATRTLLGSHPYWLGHDRVMADEFFRPYFTHGVWANGELAARASGTGHDRQQLERARHHRGPAHARLRVSAARCGGCRRRTSSAPTARSTIGSGTRTSRRDSARPTRIATRTGSRNVSTAAIPRTRRLRLADSLNLFEPGSLAPDVTVHRGALSVALARCGRQVPRDLCRGGSTSSAGSTTSSRRPAAGHRIVDKGFYVQAAFYPVKKKLELYGGTSWVFGDKDAGFKTQHEWLGGANWFFAPTRELSGSTRSSSG